MKDFSADVKLAKKGDTTAFSRLYETVYKDLYHIALYSLKSSHDASDVVSDTVLDAFCSIDKLRDPEKFRNWIMKILSAKIKRRQKEYFNVTEEIGDDFPDISDFDYDSVELKEALNKLDSQSRMMLSMSVLGGYTSDEISEMCEIKSGTVRSRLSRIKEKLRLELTT
ncbi:MAG: sigma-70 family RNA polymerase sigma factor [Prevotella sp.]|nr:sigma-70 family RNA polymerase sigma factor [Alistipes senegalensis]MCM1358756.1 sigma-70 family RNA polymerase sigma factor [Prevotella sp.]MCM1473397.1 sigma-70 family RNA polymerase sigma factor [Muribaculaceae bacterium]